MIQYPYFDANQSKKVFILSKLPDYVGAGEWSVGINLILKTV